MALIYKQLHEPVSKKELNGINSILRTVTEYNDSITLNNISEYGLFTVTDDTLVVTGGMPTATYTINNELSMVINEDGDGELPLTERLDSKIDLRVTFPQYYSYPVYDLVLSSNTPIIQTRTSAIVTARLTRNGTPYKGETLTYAIKHNATTIDIGTSTTDSNGEFEIQYTGTGIGEITIEVKYDDLLQKTYKIIDGLFYDAATSTPPENTWVINGFSPSYSTIDGTTLTSSTFATAFANLIGTGVNPFDWDSPCIIEFDVTSISSENADFQIYDNTNNCTRSFRNLGITNNDHVKILVESEKIRYFVNDIEKTNSAFDIAIGTFRCGFRATGSLTFKNFVIYPVSDLVLTCSTPIIETGDTALINVLLLRDGSGYGGETLSYSLKHGSTTIDNGSVTTGNDGTAIISYTGTGAGNITIEVNDDSSKLKETYMITDCVFYDDMLSDTVSNYIFSTNQGNSLVSQNDGFLFSGGASARYFQRQYGDVSSLIGKTIRFEVTGVPSNQWRLGIFPYANGSYTTILGEYTTDSGTIHLDYTFDDNAMEHVLFRVYVNGTGYTLKTRDFKVYLI